jgi:AraC-like DNA-binding protein
VEDVHRDGGPHGKTAEGFSGEYQVCFPYRGVFVWHVGGDHVVGDPNQVIFVRGGESYRVSGPLADGYGELIISPDSDLLSEIARVNGRALFDHPLFRRRYWRASPSLQSFRTRFLHWVSGAARNDCLEADESIIALLHTAFRGGASHDVPCAATARLIRRTKLFLQTHLPMQIRLADIGRAVGGSPAYLTDVFRRVEGISLHQYLTQLRLARALVDLPHTDNLTMLAIDNGFSSHSHFSAAFRRAFGCTPSQFRRMTRQQATPYLCEAVAVTAAFGAASRRTG